MSIETPEELAGLRAAGNVVSLMLESMKRAVEVGVTTGELDEVGASVMRQHSLGQLLHWFTDFRG